MKKNKKKGKLDLKKTTITSLNKKQLAAVVGGRRDLTSVSCVPWPTSLM